MTSSKEEQAVFTFANALNVIKLKHRPPLINFPEMWYQIFLWALFSSVFVHLIAAVIAFTTLRKHRFGKFFPVFILSLGIFAPMTSGVVSSASIAFVYRAATMEMMPLYALFWGVGQTLVSAAVGFTRILATL
ncbi:unnamed protein product [Bemisia tabaci]|uniref:Transmembrane protein 170A n=1 Tax=Bemisia tabaci TaxID=7038 RepID=A0A9P0A046_BEMTA|nr:PREDICTED: transmembrane protein 170A [Bemisia tabaci]XP_018913051.1 PREDICTED: transmembrane protein 170A [Bemisia tabaci]CAH0381208.1 unnamed protein product [Bemisia tabaci]